uniref:Calmodulin-lysine N-methyltransferase n=1 Tax=Leptocylindrus danicus TaxID=163516 RepID=A0A7S2PT78_9STRA|mmetsp:Transcript_9428/g.14177  ORF Transcript_9428/g.14177 Transcript_9428/m.14177 type:complete len:257 (+) Transcript_9428:74-844(+)
MNNSASFANENDEDKQVFMDVNGRPIYFSEDWNVGIGGGLWSTGKALSFYFANHAEQLSSNLMKLKAPCKQTSGPGVSALELGSGNGFLSIVLAAALKEQGYIGIDELVVTDFADHLPLISRTVEANSHIFTDKSDDIITSTQCKNCQMHVVEHQWGVESVEPVLLDKKFDFIFGSDLAYRDSLHAPLIASLNMFSHSHTISLIGVTMVDTTPSFFTALEKAGFCFERLADGLLDPQFRGGTFGIIAIQKKCVANM